MTLGTPGILILLLFSISLTLSVIALMQGLTKENLLTATIGKKNGYLRLSYMFFLAAVSVSVTLFILASLTYRGGGGVGVE